MQWLDSWLLLCFIWQETYPSPSHPWPAVKPEYCDRAQLKSLCMADAVSIKKNFFEITISY